ncbi:MAG: hypothetical protein ACRDRV_11690, partial [Pseudonocardiaceae bacterium]
MRRPPYRHPCRTGTGPRPFAPLLLVLGAVLLATGTTVVITLVTVLRTVAPVVLVCVAVVALS